MKTKNQIKKELEYMLEDIIYEVDEFKNRMAEVYFNTLHSNGIEDKEFVVDLFDKLMEGHDDFDFTKEAVETLMEEIERR